jgi:hypothetical protein
MNGKAETNSKTIFEGNWDLACAVHGAANRGFIQSAS